MLGLVPGWGGAYLLPNLVGADERRHGDHREPAQPGPDAQAAPQAFELGIADAVLRAAPTSSSSRCSGPPRVLTGDVTVERAEVDRGDGWDAAVARGRGSPTARPAAPRPPRTGPLELIAAARDRDPRRRLRRRGRGARPT